MKRLISLFTTFALVISLAPTAFAYDSEEDELSNQEEVIAEEMDLSGEYFDDIFGDGGAYQIVSVAPTEEGSGFAVSYIAESDTTLAFSAVNDDTGETILSTSLPVGGGSGTVVVDAPLYAFPQFYRVDAALAADDEVFTYYDHTHAFQDFLMMRSDDGTFSDRVILNYGEGFDGTENFAVVSEDVKVVYVDSMDDVSVVGTEDSAALFNLMDGAQSDAYIFDGMEDGTLAGLESGDKLLILPRDDVNDAKTLIVGSVEETASLYADDEDGAVTVTPAEAEPEMEEFFDFVRIHVEVEADTDNLDTSDADPDVVVEEEAELFGSINGSRTASKSFTLGKTLYGINVRDTFTLSARVSLSINYSWLTLRSVNASATLTATNNFTIKSTRNISYSNQWYVGTIPVGTVSGVTFSIPVYITFYASLGASFNYTAIQTTSTTVSANYSGGRYSCTTSKSANRSYSLKTSAYATVRLGIKGTVQAKLSIVNLAAGVTGEVGVQLSGSYRNRAFSGSLAVYVQPSFSITWFRKTLVSRTWPMSTSTIASIYSRAAYYTMTDFAKYDNVTINGLIEKYEKEDGIAVTITSAEELKKFAEYVNAGKPTAGVVFTLNSAEDTIALADNWTPIGNSTSNPFRGVFGGSGITITGLNVPSGDIAGLFGCVVGGTIHDIYVKDATVSGKDYVGGIAGSATEGSKIYDVSVSGTVQSSGGEVGGIVGRMTYSSLLNSYSTADVNGNGAVGGVIGTLTYGTAAGQLANCYSSGTVTMGSGFKGGVCGEVVSNDDSDYGDDEARYKTLGINACYYRSANGLDAVGKNDKGVAVGAFAVTDASTAVNGAKNLTDALNTWYAQYGAYRLEGETWDGSIPEADPGDYFNRWYPDVQIDSVYLNGGWPLFASRGKTYPLTVYYVYEDGSEAYKSTTIYLALGESFNVTRKTIDGYTTNVDEETGYKGWMNPGGAQTYTWGSEEEKESFTGLEYRIVYSPITNYKASAKTLTASSADAASGTIYKIEDQVDLAGLAAYVNAGKNTKGVIFEQAKDIAISAPFTSIGTAGHPFEGTYKGDYMSITGLTAPLFGAVEGAALEAILLAPNITTGSGSIGALAGTAKDSTITDCKVTGATASVSAAENVGGLLGTADSCTIAGCSVEGTVQGDVAGGLAAVVTGGSIVNCAVTAAVTGTSNAGGLIGSADNAVVKNSYANGNVSATNAGGLAGSVNGGAFSNCYSVGSRAFGDKTVASESVYTLASSASDVEKLALRDALNAWVAATTSTDYLTWTRDLVVPEKDEEIDNDKASGMTFPVFGAAYSNWLTDFKLADGKVTFRLNTDLYSGGSAFIAVYSEAGQMLKIEQIVKDEGTGNPTVLTTLTNGVGSIAAGQNASYAKAFTFDEAAMPSAAAVRTAD